jgi:hypothetical protein
MGGAMTARLFPRVNTSLRQMSTQIRLELRRLWATRSEAILSIADPVEYQ